MAGNQRRSRVIGGFAGTLYCNGYAAQIARNLLRRAARARVAFNGKNHTVELWRCKPGESLHGVKGANRRAAARERRKSAAIEPAADVQHHFAAGFAAADTR